MKEIRRGEMMMEREIRRHVKGRKEKKMIK